MAKIQVRDDGYGNNGGDAFKSFYKVNLVVANGEHLKRPKLLIFV